MTEEKTYLKVEELKPCYLYRIKARNGTVGLWNPDKGEFVLSRYKFGNNYTFGEIHWDLDPNFGTAKPWEELEKSPFELEDLESRIMTWEEAGLEKPSWAKTDGATIWYNPKEEELLKYLNMWEHKLNDPHPKERYDG